MALATLSIDIVAKLASLEQGLANAGRLNEKAIAQMDARWAALGKTIAGVVSVGAITAFIKNTIDGLDKLNDVADVTGAAIGKIGGLEDVGARTGAGIDVIETALVKMNAALKDTDPDSGTSLALKQIGLDTAALRQLDPADALTQIAQRLAQFADDGNKARLVQELFGKSVKEVGPFLKDLAERGLQNNDALEAQAKAAEKFNQQLFASQKNTLDLARNIAGPLLTAYNDLYEKLKSFGSIRGFIEADLGLDERGRLKSQAEALSADVGRATDSVLRLSEALQRDPGNELLAGRLEKARTRLEGLQRSAAATSDALKGLADKMAPRATGATGDFSRSDRQVSVGEPPAKKEKGSGESEAQRYLEGLQKQIEKTLELTTYEQALNEIQQRRIKGITPALKQQILATARLVDENKRVIDQRTSEIDLATRLGKAELDRIAKLQEGNKVMADEIELIGLDIYGQGAIEKARIRSTRTLKEEERARREANGATEETLQALDAEIAALKERENLIERRTQANVDEQNKKTALDANSDFTRRAAENIQDTLSGQLFKVYKGDFDNILEGWGDLLLKMAAEAQAAQINKALFGSTVGGQGDGILGSLINAAANYFGSSSVPTGDGSGATGDFTRFDRSVSIRKAAEGLDRVPYDGFIAQLHKDEKVVPAKYRDSGSGVVNNIVVRNEAGDVAQASAQARPNGTGGADLEVMVKRLVRQTVAGDVASGAGPIPEAMKATWGLNRQTMRRS